MIMPRCSGTARQARSGTLRYLFFVMAKKLPTDDLFEKSTMTFGEHLEELRVCLFRSVVGVAMGCLIGFFVANWVVRFFQSPLERAMAQYYVEKAVGDFGNLIGRTPPVEVERQILDEG